MPERVNPYEPPVEEGVQPETPDSTEGTESTPVRDFGFAIFLAGMIFVTMLAVAILVQIVAWQL